MDHSMYTFQSQYQQDDALENENYYSVINEDVSLEYEDEDAILISLVQDYPFLYNKELTDFKDNIKKQNAWAEIATAVNITEECQSRWTRLRERYTREKNREAESTTGSRAVKRKPFEFYENMQFLERFIKRRRRKLQQVPNRI
ncbi:transcription factor Adf-1-like [Nylanderia fulva]|uniref:transcription factor Adf-1-like n=1 Tax=Nylanderia fulva TaxID=613905 RepID=UPI0010FB2A50|nr:transcription factor Adf-1-like [Nylanderia fulva]